MNASRKTLDVRAARLGALARLPVFFALAGKRAVIAGGSAAAALAEDSEAGAFARARRD